MGAEFWIQSLFDELEFNELELMCACTCEHDCSYKSWNTAGNTEITDELDLFVEKSKNKRTILFSQSDPTEWYE